MLRSLSLPLMLAAVLLQTACGTTPVQVAPVYHVQPAPVQLAPVPQGFQTSMMGLQGEEVELSGIYTYNRSGAMLQLRNGEQVMLTDAQGVVLPQLRGIENRSMLRVRGFLRAVNGLTRPQLGLVAGLVVRI